MERRFTYDCVIAAEDGGFVASFPQLPEAYAEGATREEALANAADVLRLSIAGRIGDGSAVPAYERSAEVVALSVEVGDEYVDETRYMTQSQAADALGVSLSRVAALIASGTLEARRFDGRREVSIASVNAYSRAPRKAGRPKAATV